MMCSLAPVLFRLIVAEKLIGTLHGLLRGNCSRPGELSEDVADPKPTSLTDETGLYLNA